ncbi:MAG: ferritin-like domain-containing protein [Bryobacteraceae bacterium]
MTTIKDLFTAEIKDLYSAEKQLIKALPKMVAGANDPELKAGLKAHLEETKEQAARLERIAEMLGTKASGKLCKGMEGLVAEGSEALSEDGTPAVLDLGIIGAACRVEHYEMAGYMCAIALAEQLGHTEAVNLLNESLAEENSAEGSLREKATALMNEAGDGDGAPESSTQSTKKSGMKAMAGKA